MHTNTHTHTQAHTHTRVHTQGPGLAKLLSAGVARGFWKQAFADQQAFSADPVVCTPATASASISEVWLCVRLLGCTANQRAGAFSAGLWLETHLVQLVQLVPFVMCCLVASTGVADQLWALNWQPVWAVVNCVGGGEL